MDEKRNDGLIEKGPSSRWSPIKSSLTATLASLFVILSFQAYRGSYVNEKYSQYTIISSRDYEFGKEETNRSVDMKRGGLELAEGAMRIEKARTNISNANTKSASEFEPSLNTSGCLITKDDLALIPEWIAYHYHVMQMRYLLVAIDPDSITNVSIVIERVREELPDLTILQFRDEEFLPRWFVVEKNYTRVRAYYRTFWRNDPEERRLSQLFAIHQFRQRSFAHFCTVRVRERQRQEQELLVKSNATISANPKRQPNLLMHIDSDEFVVPNSKWRSDPNITSFLPSSVPQEATAGSVVRFLRDVHKYFPHSGHPYPRPSDVCNILMMVTFGGFLPSMISKEEIDNMTNFESIHWIGKPDVPSPLNASRFETIAYRFHQTIIEKIQGPPQKAIMDVDINGPLPSNDRTVKGPEIDSIHHPSVVQCRKMKRDSDMHRDPLMLNHYKGSLERFTFREDLRRTPERYKSQAMVHDQQDDGWILTWIKYFVREHGIEKVTRLLGDHFLLGKEDVWVATKRKIDKIEPKKLANNTNTATMNG